MVAAVFDTNILIDHLNGVGPARDEIRRFTHRQISIITWMEALVGVTDDLEARTRHFSGSSKPFKSTRRSPIAR